MLKVSKNIACRSSNGRTSHFFNSRQVNIRAFPCVYLQALHTNETLRNAAINTNKAMNPILFMVFGPDNLPKPKKLNSSTKNLGTRNGDTRPDKVKFYNMYIQSLDISKSWFSFSGPPNKLDWSVEKLHPWQSKHGQTSWQEVDLTGRYFPWNFAARALGKKLIFECFEVMLKKRRAFISKERGG